MIVKFLPTHTGGGVGSVNYLLNKRVEQGTSRILKGSEAQTKALIQQLKFKQKTCFGVLSFEEKSAAISETTKKQIMEDFEETLLGNMKDRVNILWVEHSDKGRLELNFLIPKVDLQTGKSFNPYFDKYDRDKIDLWKRTINNEYNFSSPDDPAKQNTIQASKKNKENYSNLEELDRTLHELVKQGHIQNRDNIIELLQEQGFTITRQNKSGITIIFPNSKVKNRLKGGIYGTEFSDYGAIETISDSQIRRIKQYNNRDIQEECLRNRQRIRELIQKRDKYNSKKFNRPSKQKHQEQRRDINRSEQGINKHTRNNESKFNRDENIKTNNNDTVLSVRDNDRSINRGDSKLVSNERLASSKRVADNTEEQRQYRKLFYKTRQEYQNIRIKKWQPIYIPKEQIDDTARESIKRRKRRIIKIDRETKHRNKEFKQLIEREREREREAIANARELERKRRNRLYRIREQIQEFTKNFTNRVRELVNEVKQRITREQQERIKEFKVDFDRDTTKIMNVLKEREQKKIEQANKKSQKKGITLDM